MTKLLEIIAQALVDIPRDVEVNEIRGEKTIVLELRVAKEDVGRIIGRNGRIADAIRTILSAAGMKYGIKASLEIIDQGKPPGTGDRPGYAPRPYDRPRDKF
ncbi:MAG: KH domain-containing protein [Deltaproteobacteria bacterium]|nr:KH domain-containing protein [Deltaproteobacteria bacterium]